MVPGEGLPPEEDDQLGSDDPSEGEGSGREQPTSHSQAPKGRGRRIDKKRGGKRERRRERGVNRAIDADEEITPSVCLARLGYTERPDSDEEQVHEPSSSSTAAAASSSGPAPPRLPPKSGLGPPPRWVEEDPSRRTRPRTQLDSAAEVRERDRAVLVPAHALGRGGRGRSASPASVEPACDVEQDLGPLPSQALPLRGPSGASRGGARRPTLPSSGPAVSKQPAEPVEAPPASLSQANLRNAAMRADGAVHRWVLQQGIWTRTDQFIDTPAPTSYPPGKAPYVPGGRPIDFRAYPHTGVPSPLQHPPGLQLRPPVSHPAQDVQEAQYQEQAFYKAVN